MPAERTPEEVAAKLRALLRDVLLELTEAPPPPPAPPPTEPPRVAKNLQRLSDDLDRLRAHHGDGNEDAPDAH